MSILFGIILFYLVEPCWAQHGLSLLFSGERRSELEPCGCIAKQQGGVQFEATLYRRQESTGTPFLRLDSGGWTDPFVRTQLVSAMKTRYLLEALSGMDFDAINFGRPEMELSAEFFTNLARRRPQAMAHVISANVFLTSSPQMLAFPDSRILTRRLAGGREIKIGITGATTQDLFPSRSGRPDPKQAVTESYLAKPPRECLTPVLARLRPHVDLLIVLFYGSYQPAAELAKAFPEIDCLILTRREFNQEETKWQMGGVSLLSVRNCNGREVSRIGLEQNPQTRKWSLKGQPEWLAVTQDLPPDPAMVKLLAEFKKETMTLQVLPPPNAPILVTARIDSVVPAGLMS